MRRFVKYLACGLCVVFILAGVKWGWSRANKNHPNIATMAPQINAMAPVAQEEAKPPLLNIPIPIGQSAKGVRFPYFDENGKLKMFFNVDVMMRNDNEHLKMTNAKIETYDDDSNPDMTVLLPVSLLDLNSRILTSDQSFVVRRQDFALMGETLQLDTNTRQGKVTGKVKMVIFNLGVADKTDSPHE